MQVTPLRLFANLLSVALVFGVIGPALAQQDTTDVARSHVEANVPPPSDFDVLLRRDLTTYFRKSNESVDVTYELLRRGPTQSGVAYPKFYAWVTVNTPKGPLVQGAVRVAAIDRVRFEVTDYLSQSDIVRDPDSVRLIFPAPLVPRIVERAMAK